MPSWDIHSLELEPHHPQVLTSDDEMRVIAINLPGGESLQEHQVYERALLFVADGRIELERTDGNTTAAGPGFIAEFKPRERREIRALEDSRLVLVLAPWPGEGHPSQPAG